ncbi:hypothetical protein WJX74_002274 [Apatococcus lobatus]|uniref:tRNA (guanine-N(7)-)-methyltransferase n=1 Tax=Apatococcus lobatus TaxID=904363 RepID=A0AAW1R0A3_9CHLO
MARGGKRQGMAEGRAERKGQKAPRKRFYRTRAHSNPLSDMYFPVPSCPKEDAPETPKVEFADVGCGFGGLLIRLAPLFPDRLMVGMEIRDKVAEYVQERIANLRREHEGQYQNISCIRTNSQKFLVHYFCKGQLQKLFFLFPDPHFKAQNHRRRIISLSLLAEYAYLLAPGGRMYTITDVPELAEWMKSKVAAHPSFRPLTQEELDADVAAGLLITSSEEGQKVERNSGQTWRMVYQRL